MTLKCSLISFVVGIFWTTGVACQMADQYIWSDYVRDGVVWFGISTPVLYCLMRELGHGHPFMCAVLSAFLFGLPFGYAAMFAAYPTMIIPIIVATIGIVVLIGIYPMLMWIDYPFEKETM